MGINYKDIKKFTHDAGYVVNVSWDYLETHLQHYRDTMEKRGEVMELDPDFQRGHVWTEDKQTAYVEFCLRGGKSSRDIQFNCPGWMNDHRGPLVLVDGKQRLEAVRKFMRNELRVFNGNLLSEIEGISHGVRRSDFVFKVNSLPTRAQVLTWYLELNSGGVVHTEDELARVRQLLEEESK